MDLNLTDNSSFVQFEELTCSGADDIQLNWYHHFAWWVEGFLQLATGEIQPQKLISGSVVYIDQQTGAPHAVCWWK